MKMKCLAIVFAALATYGGTAAWVLAAPGELDPAFGENGFVRISAEGEGDFEDSGHRSVGVWAQSDGKLLIGRSGDLDDFSVLRLNVDGTPDLGFDGAGQTSLAVPNLRGEAYAVIQLSDGKIVAAGPSLGGEQRGS